MGISVHEQKNYGLQAKYSSSSALFNYGLWQTEADESLILRLVWSTEGITGQSTMETASLAKPKPKPNKQTKR